MDTADDTSVPCDALKSDQNGIEIENGKKRLIVQEKLKSDQNGIEI